ncbi:glycoside hydrolase [Fimicolochytrium jonesii]|uniref:glycoside hydrolase n=1 Tax=Fimicolochytrium jonesii TaxID=1396493 RepID=UPI0022FF03C2|nr:glycoside hydrolase [Fimicolochytrium jonesii]KAI8823716.1 glycoside hydrolase [Fimicolochytrium jonesii]
MRFSLPTGPWLVLAAALTSVVSCEPALDQNAAAAAANQSLFWGTYRPNLYFGTRTRSADTLLTGLMWFGVNEVSQATIQNIRHTCEQGDDLSGYAWQKHDGRTFGSQLIKDTLNKIHFKTEFVKTPGGDHGGDWTVRVSGEPFAGETADISVVFYVTRYGKGEMRWTQVGGHEGVVGHTEELGEFTFAVVDGPNNKPPATPSPGPDDADLRSTLKAQFRVPEKESWKAKEILQQHLVQHGREKLQKAAAAGTAPSAPLVFTLENEDVRDANVFMFQKTLRAPFSFDVAFLSHSARAGGKKPDVTDVQRATGPALQEKLGEAEAAFDQRFEDTFGLAAKGYDKDQQTFAQSLLGNMVGGLGYFHGTSIVDRALEGVETSEIVDFAEGDDDDDENEDSYFESGGSSQSRSSKRAPNPQLEGPTALFTAVPSRPFFPRGFLWDEGFHQLLIGKWDNDLSLDILSHWIALIDDKGWVAREQILGDEARSKVPQEFQTQYPHFANPPTLVMSLMAYLDRLTQARDTFDVSSSQQKIVAASDTAFLKDRALLDREAAVEFLNATYPRLRKQYEWFRETQWGEPGLIEGRAVEGYRWRGRKDTHTLTSGLDDYPRAMPPHKGEFHIDLLSWMAFYASTLKTVAHEINRTKDIKTLTADLTDLLASLESLHWNADSQSYCDVSIDEGGKSSFVVHKGYISLFPLMLGLLPADHPHLGAVLDLVADPSELWTEFGIASLSRRDRFYGTGENYWRGPVWINMNYLVCASLHKNYVNVPGPHQKQAQEIYTSLRKNLVSNVYKEYKRTGYVWEQYSSQDGEGKRSHPFTGWTALILLIMAEQY